MSKSAAAARQKAKVYNMLPNLVWSVLHLAPITYFCFMILPPRIGYLFLGIGFLGGLLPASLLRRMQLGKTTRIYKKIGIRLIRKFSQDGDLINRRIRREFPEYTVIPTGRSADAYIKQTWLFERFHLMLLFFFLLVTAYALAHRLPGWAILITVNNVLYNLYPIFLQQYNRIRIGALQRRADRHTSV